MEIDLSPSEYKKVVSLINTYLPDTDVWAFGSRVKFTSKPESDLDLVAFTALEQHANVLALKDAFISNDLPFKVDLLEWETIPENFKENISNNYVLLNLSNDVPQGWNETKLGDLLTLNYGKALVANNRIPGNIPVYSSSGISGSHNEALIKTSGVIVGRKGTVGSVYYSNVPFYCIDTAFYIIPKQDYDLRFIYYKLLSMNLVKLSSDSAVPGLNRETAYAQKLIVPQNIKQQKLIRAILSSLDDKIELNILMNQTLEEMSRTIFKEWFINFNFPGFDGELINGLPQGWKTEPIDENIEYLNGLALQKFPSVSNRDFFPVIKIKELKQGVTDVSDKANTLIPDKYIVQDGDVLFSWSGSLDVAIWSGPRGALNQHLFKVSSDIYPKWYYYYWTKHFLPKYQTIAAGKATTMGHIQRKHLTESDINVPDTKTMKIANEIFSPILEKYICNNLQINSLKLLRDNLLPRLMTGKITIKPEHKWKTSSNLKV